MTIPPELSSARAETLRAVSERIGHEFRDLTLLDRALTHASLGNEGRLSYERLEFLGDAVLGFVVADHLYSRTPEIPEGELTDQRAQRVSREPLSRIAKKLDLKSALAVGRGLRSQELDSPRIQADLVEAILGAVYVDGGIRAARKFVRKHVLSKGALEIIAKKKTRDAKSRLLHLAQCHGLGQPRYVLVESTGPDHDRTFTVSVTIGGDEYGTGTAKSKQAAEMEAAEVAVEALRRNIEDGEAEDAGS